MDLQAIIGAEIIKELSKKVVKFLSEKLSKKTSSALEINDEIIEVALAQHLTMVNNWAATIMLRDMSRPKMLNDIYVDLDLSFRSQKTKKSHKKAKSLVASSENVMILGGPGAGKTTTVRKIAALLSGLNPNKYKYPSVPILIVCRSLSKGESLTEHLIGVLGLREKVYQAFNGDKTIDGLSSKDASKVILINALNGLRAVLLIDGLDETNYDDVDRLNQEIEGLSMASAHYRLIVTCRTGANQRVFSCMNLYETSPLTTRQIGMFAKKWLGKEAEKFLEQVRNSPYFGSEVRPLVLAHLCIIYDRIGEIPEQPKAVYASIIRLFLQDWDLQRGIKRVSKYAKFGVDQKEEFLEGFSFELAVNGRVGAFRESELEEAYIKISEDYGLPKRSVASVVGEIQSHTGIINQVSAGVYEFSHLSLQEYLAARYIVKLPTLSVPIKSILSFPGIMGLATALSSKPSDFLVLLVHKLLRYNRSMESLGHFEGFFSEYLLRLMSERVEFKSSEEFGICLFFVTAISDLSFSSHDKESKGIGLFFGSVAIRESMRIFENNAKIILKDGDAFLYPRYKSISMATKHEHLAHEVFSALNYSDSIRIPSVILNSLGWKKLL